ncbi:MAG: hypothetical protein ACUZ8H_16000 [Candidatus Anammoxibacter sp.]
MPKFEKGNEGRPKGAKNKITKSVKDVFASVFESLQSDPKAKLEVWAKENQTEFYKLSSKLIPAAIEAKIEGSMNINWNETKSYDGANKKTD